MNRTQRAKIRAAREALDMAREFKNDALSSMLMCSYGNTQDRFKSEKEYFKSKQKEVRRQKKYNGPTGLMTEENYMEVFGF